MSSSGSAKQILVVGAGPAGLSAALWLKHLGLAPHVIDEDDRLGGMQKLNFLANEWVLGQIGQSGPQLCERFRAHMEQENIAIQLGSRLCALALRDGLVTATLWDRSTGETRTRTFSAAILATGLRYRATEVLAGVGGLELLSESEIAYGPFAFAGLEGLREKRVLIIGCGDNAFENAKMLLELGAAPTLICRSRPRAQRHLFEAFFERRDRGRLFEDARILSLRREQAGIRIDFVSRSVADHVVVDKLHVLAGYVPNTEFLKTALGAGFDDLDRDEDGYIKTDDWGRTTLSGLYAAGDVCNPQFPNVVSAIASGAKTAKAVELDLRDL